MIINIIFLSLPHSSLESSISGQFQKASSHTQAAIWAMPSVDSKGAEAGPHFSNDKEWMIFLRGELQRMEASQNVQWSVSSKEDGHCNDTGLLWWSGESPPPPSPPLSSPSFSFSLYLTTFKFTALAQSHAHDIFMGIRYLQPNLGSWDVSGGNHSEDVVS